jgi:hypothetical protein
VEDPANPGQYFLYASGGRDANGFVADINFSVISTAANSGQTVGAFGALGASLNPAKADHAIFFVTSGGSNVVTAGDVWMFMGPGAAQMNNAGNDLQVAELGSDGDVMSFGDVSGPNPGREGYASFSANGQLFLLGGANGSPSNGNDNSGEMVAPAPTIDNWDGLGPGSLIVPRIHVGSTQESAFFYLSGGTTNAASASASVELTVQ